MTDVILQARNPYLAAWRLRRRRRAAERGWRGRLAALLPVAGLVAAGFLGRDTLFGFLDGPALAAGMAGLGFRLALATCGTSALVAYTALVRGRERAILAPHPARPRLLPPYLLRRLSRSTALVPAGCGLLLLPVLVEGHAGAWLGGSLVAAGGWWVGLAAGPTLSLAAVAAAHDPRWVALLEWVRGANPRMQAALIYAPGLVLLVGGLAAQAAAWGLALVLAGRAVGALLLAVPWVGGALLAWPAPALAARHHDRVTATVAEVDALHAAVDGDDRGPGPAYLEWAARYVPVRWRLLLVDELRCGWRAHRSWITGAWGLGLVAFLAGWTPDADGPARAAAVAGAGTAVVSFVAFRVAAARPAWLQSWLGLAPPSWWAPRAFALLGWLQGAVLPAGLGVLLRGTGAAGWWLRAEALVAALAVSGAASVPLRFGPAIHGTVAVLAWALLAGGGLS